MQGEQVEITPFLNTCILDSDPAFCGRLKTLLTILGVKNIRAMHSADAFAQFVKAEPCDLAFVEIADCFDDVWAELEEMRDKGGVLVIGVSDDRRARDWLWAIQRGADTILLKPYHTCLLREMLAHLLASPAARRCRIVQFPTGLRQNAPDYRVGTRKF